MDLPQNKPDEGNDADKAQHREDQGALYQLVNALKDRDDNKKAQGGEAPAGSGVTPKSPVVESQSQTERPKHMMDHLMDAASDDKGPKKELEAEAAGPDDNMIGEEEEVDELSENTSAAGQPRMIRRRKRVLACPICKKMRCDGSVVHDGDVCKGSSFPPQKTFSFLHQLCL